MDDIRRGLCLAGDLNPQELNVAQSLIFESAVTSVVFADGARGMVDGEVPFIRRIVDILVEKMHNSGTFFPSVQDFVAECENHQFLPAQFFASLRHQTANAVRVLQQQQHQLQQLQHQQAQLQQQQHLELHQLELQHQHQQALAQQQQLQFHRQSFANNQAKSTPQPNYATAPHNPTLLGNHVVVNNFNPHPPTPPTGTTKDTRSSQRSSSFGSLPGSIPSSQSISSSSATGTSSSIVSRENTPPDSPPEDTATSLQSVGSAAGLSDPSQDITTIVNGNGIVIIVPSKEVNIIPPKDDFETSEIGTRFLAEIRRGGMDILFPPKKHDHVLVIIFSVFRLMGSTAHKELIDLIMNMKESGTVPHLDNISKTKVRGVIALLKLAAIIETHGGTTEKVPVNLTLSPHIECFETLREQHDEYIRAFGQSLPDLWGKEENWSKLVWGKSLLRWTSRLTEVENIIPNLLKSPPMIPLVEAAGDTRVGEIFVTREQAYKSTAVYRSFSFDFGSTDDESASLYPIGMVQVYADEDDDDGDGLLTSSTSRDGGKGGLKLSGRDETEALLLDAMVGAGSGPLSPPSSGSKSEGTETESTDSFPEALEFFHRTAHRYRKGHNTPCSIADCLSFHVTSPLTPTLPLFVIQSRPTQQAALHGDAPQCHLAFYLECCSDRGRTAIRGGEGVLVARA